MRYFSAALFCAFVLVGVVFAAEATPDYYKKADTWFETLRLSREALVASESAGAPAKPAESPEQWTPWQHIGPFSGGKKSAFSEAFPPETEIDLKKSYGNLKWTAHPEWADGEPHDMSVPGNAAFYLYRTVTVTAPKTINAGFGSDDGMKFWLNGKLLISKDVPRGVEANQDQAKLELVAGENKLLFKVHNQSGGCGFYFAAGASASQSPKQRVREALWNLVQSNFGDPQARRQMNWEKADNIWTADWTTGDIKALADRYAQATKGSIAAQARELAGKAKTAADLLPLREAYCRSKLIEEAQAQMKDFDLEALRRAIVDLNQTYGAKYPKGKEYLDRVNALEKALAAMTSQGQGAPQADLVKISEEYRSLRCEALLANPLLDFDKLLLVKREAKKLGMPQNWQGNSSINPNMINEIALMNVKEKDPKLETFYKPEKPVFVGDLELNFDADKMLFSSIGANGRWQIFEMKMDGTGLRQVSPSDSNDIDSYDPMYLGDGRILFVGSSGFQGVPCVGGADYVGNLHIMTPDGKNIRRLTYDQDNDWCPTMLADGSVLYTRWEYTDSAHYFSRTLMRMNPDGTNQTAFYHSNSYWPNSIFYARQIPNAPSQFVAVISGHHGSARMGELVLFDVAKGRHEAEGAVQRIPGYGKKVESIIKDGLVDGSWPKFLHPYPLSDKYFLVAMQPRGGNWGIYLVDVFDNLLLLKEEPGYALLEPVPFRKNERPRAIADKIKPGATTATVMLQDVNAGPGLRGVPRGTVKSLRLFQYEYSYRNMGGHYVIGMEGPWDVRRMIGTVPIQPDGSAMFEIPANTPVAVQPLDSEGKALQQMRSWFVGMPGEVVSCTGCHESQNDASMVKANTAATKKPVVPTPWYGPKRGFGFVREVQPMLDKYCAGCHDGKQAKPNLADSRIIRTSDGMSSFPLSYTELHPFVRRNGPEGDYHLLTPLEFHADTSELVQMLRKGHYNVKLDAEAWDRLITWIDLNVPCYGTWHEVSKVPNNFAQRRYELKKQYAGIDEDIEAIPEIEKKPITFVKPEPMAPRPAALAVDGWPIAADKVKQMQQALGDQECKLDLGGGQAIVLKRIPAGTFAMGDVNGEMDEFPMAKVTIEKPFWMGATEVSLAQYQQFNQLHKNGYYDQHYKDQVRPGYLMDNSTFPVIRVSWDQAMEFCKWLSQKSGKKVTLPTEAQWEWACRAGTNTPMNYGDLDSDFSKLANLGDKSLTLLAVRGVDPKPFPNPDKFWDFVPKEARFNDGVLHLADVGHYQPNAWGLHDMHGNVAEWTLTNYRPYPYDAKAGKDDATAAGRKVVRGGSWYERPKYARSAFRLSFPQWQMVYNVGFRVIIEDQDNRVGLSDR